MSTFPDRSQPEIRSPISAIATWLDVFVSGALAAAGSCLIWNTSHRISVGLRSVCASDVWFEGDVSRVFANMSARHSDQYRSSVHPIFALIANPACVAFHRILRFSFDDSADLFLALTAGLWVVAMYAVLRGLGFGRSLATMSALLGLVTASGLLFFSVPETCGLASVSILLAIAFIVFTEGTRWQNVGTLLASASSLSMTVTNWSFGLLLTIRGRPTKR